MCAWVRHALGPFLIHMLSEPFLGDFIVHCHHSLPSLFYQPFWDQEFKAYLQLIPSKKAKPFPSPCTGSNNLHCMPSPWLVFLLSSPRKDMHTENGSCKIRYIKIHEKDKAPGCFFLLGYSCWNLGSGCGILFLPSPFWCCCHLCRLHENVLYAKRPSSRWPDCSMWK